MVVSTFSMLDKDNRERFFVESLLLADAKPDVVLGMLFLTMSNINFDFQAWDLQWKSYTTRDVLLTTRQVELMGKKEFVAAAFDPEYKVFVVYIAVLSIDSGDEIHPSKRAQIAYLKMDKAPTKVFGKYADFIDIFSPKLVVKLPEYTEINNHTIELVDDWQLLYNPIYSMRSVKLEILKAYIKNNLANDFIEPSKSPVGTLIFFDKKPNGSFRWYVDYRGLNNLTIKN